MPAAIAFAAEMGINPALLGLPLAFSLSAGHLLPLDPVAVLAMPHRSRARRTSSRPEAARYRSAGHAAWILQDEGNVQAGGLYFSGLGRCRYADCLYPGTTTGLYVVIVPFCRIS